MPERTPEREQKLFDFLKNDLLDEDLCDLAKEIYLYQGGYECFDTFTFDDISDIFTDPAEAFRAAVYGEIKNINGLFRFDGCGNIEEVYIEDLADEIRDESTLNDMVDYLFKGDWKTTGCQDIEEIFEEWEEEDEEEEEDE